MRDFIHELLDRDGVIATREHPDLASVVGHCVHRGELATVLPGIVAWPAVADTFETRVLALNRYDPDAVLTGAAAARLGFWKDLKVAVITAACKHARVDRRGFAFSRRAISEDFVIERQRTRMMCPALAALDLCTDLDGDGIDAVLRTRGATLEQLAEAIETTRWTRGQRHRRRILFESRAEPWSAAERKLHRLLRLAKIDGWQANVEVSVNDQTYYIDVGFRGTRVAIEVDGKEFHGPETFESDRLRQNNLVLDGWLVLRFTWAMLEDDPEDVIRRIREALCARAAWKSAARYR